MKNKVSDLSVLLEENPLAYYWMGLLLADGSFYENKISLHLSGDDYIHVEEFCNFIKYTGQKRNKNSISVMNTKTVKQIKEKFNIHNRKTYYPPDLSFIKDKKLLLSLVIGFIDGDGCIRQMCQRKDWNIVIKCHSSWQKTLQLMLDSICKNCNTKAYLTSDNYSQIRISNSVHIKFLKSFIYQHNLPYLERKWNKVDMNFVGKIEQSKKRTEQVQILKSQNVKNSQIAKQLNVSPGAITLIIKRNNI